MAWEYLVLTFCKSCTSQHPHLSQHVSNCVPWRDGRTLTIPFRGSSFPHNVNKIRCICGDLQTAAPGLCLVGLIEKNGELFGAWASSAPNAVALTPPEETLYQLISQGSFTPPSTSSSKKPKFRFDKWEKRALAVRLAYCLMDFFDADLSSNRFHVNRSLKEALYLSLPCKVNGSGDPYTFSIGHPALVSLAKLLLEIESGEVLPLDITPYHEHNTMSWVKLFKKVDELEKHGFDEPKYLEAIRACLLVHSQIANALESGEQTRSTRDVTIRKNLYKEIVQKIVDVFGSMNSRQLGSRKRQRSVSPEPIGRRKMFMAGRADSGDSLAGHPQSQNSSSLRVNMGDGRPSPQRGSPTRQTTPLMSLMRPSTPSSGGIFEDYSLDEYTQEVCIAADKRIGEYRNLYDEAIPYEEEPSAPRVKVAILDTGLDRSTTSIQAYSERIVEVQSWLPPRDGLASNGTDKSGHGTHVAGLLLTMAPDCDVYVAQIADENGLIPPKDIVKAIEHAATIWKVDIISMSFGFIDERDEGCSDLRKAIIEAHAKGVLMFAAASNTGAYGLSVLGPAFPARHTNVFCIYAGDGMGNPARASPPIRQNRFNFLALGEAVESAWPMSLCEKPWKKRRSGSSFATPIVAGVAASFLLYARQKLSEEDAEKCKEFDTMQRWLHHVSTYHQGYDVLSLSRFFSYEDNKRKLFLRELLDGLI
ncbi:peptidase S8/S53 domain-containing protein [Lasiosphaeris hirsuta]|uniref:Peptidase S8/S53 domain-containing protein n=1 Tax=Lasiosphaeris hirsuta TaxID=260670 RepID=A0AA40A1U1_9PEZI|nr:peptidase S8/S53 domain-containing protein [Lasiosphaeris hirsuta]